MKWGDIVIAADGFKTNIWRWMAAEHDVTDHRTSAGDAAYLVNTP